MTRVFFRINKIQVNSNCTLQQLILDPTTRFGHEEKHHKLIYEFDYGVESTNKLIFDGSILAVHVF